MSFGQDCYRETLNSAAAVQVETCSHVRVVVDRADPGSNSCVK